MQIQRHNQIMSIIRERKEISVKELCALLYQSPATIRRDLSALEKQGLIKRSYGGAVLTEIFSDRLPLAIRSAKNIAAKKRICAKAAKLIENGDTVFIDASSTAYFLAPHLKSFSDLTVITNNPHLCIYLSELKIRNHCTGGEMLEDSLSLVGCDAERMVSGILANKCFFSARGYNDSFISDTSKSERDLKIAMLDHADKCYFLCDSSKRNTKYPYIIADIKKIDGIIDEE